MSSKHTRMDTVGIDPGTRRSIIAKTLYESLSSSSPSRLPWWKRYFGCFSRRRNSNQCNQVAAVGVGGRSRKYKKIKNKTKRRKRN